jgi:hypothetical protein
VYVLSLIIILIMKACDNAVILPLLGLLILGLSLVNIFTKWRSPATAWMGRSGSVGPAQTFEARARVINLMMLSHVGYALMATGFEFNAPALQIHAYAYSTSNFIRDAWKQYGSVDWMQSGTKLIVAVDLDAGTLRAAVACSDGLPPKWIDIKSHGVSLSAETGSKIFPTIWGKGGASIKCNFGSGGEMLHTPPSPDYRTLLPLNEAQKVIFNVGITSSKDTNIS